MNNFKFVVAVVQDYDCGTGSWSVSIV